MSASLPARPSTPHRIGLLFYQAADRRLLRDFLQSLGHQIRAPMPAPGCIADWDGVSIVVADEVCARQHLKELWALKQQSGTISLPLLLAVPQTRNGTPWLEAGFDDVVRLPVAKSELAARLTALLRLREASEDRFRAEAALRERAEELAEMDRQKDIFLAMLGHELRNPLAPILNSAHSLRLIAPTEPRIQKHLSVIDRQGKQLARLVDDLLDVARISRGAIVLRKEVVVVAEIMERAAQSVRPLVEARQHRLSVTFPPTPVLTEADPARLEQILVNLLNNAAKYTEPGGELSLTAEQREGEVVLEVCDTGRGIPRAMLDHVFDPFTQVSPTIDRPLGGLGLGLALVKSLVDLHGGRITVQSEGEGLGCRFTLRLPVLNTEVTPRANEPDPQLVHPVRLRRVLIVDDNPDAAESLAEVVQFWGHEVRVAYNGPAGLLAVESFAPEVVLLDIGLPGIDGYEVARQLREQPGREKMWIFAVTGYGQESDRRKADEAGFDGHLTKPVDIADLKARLSTLDQR